MPIQVIDEEWIYPFIENRKELLKEYEDTKEHLITGNPLYHDKWNVLHLKDAFTGESDNFKKLPLLKSLINNLPDNMFFVFGIYSIINPGMMGRFHNEEFPKEKGYRRFQIPLHIPKGSRFEITGEPIYNWEVGKVYEFLNYEVMHRIIGPDPDEKEDRIMLVFDVFEDYIPNQEEIEYCYNTWTGYEKDGRKGKQVKSNS